MNANEQDLIRGLFDRMSAMGAIDKDPAADALIQDGVMRNPQAAYLLVQSVLVQEQALQAADARIKELEGKVAALEKPAPQASAAPRASAGFGGAASAGATSVPAAGSGRTSAGFGQGAGLAAAPVASPANAGSGPGRNARADANRPAGGGFMAQAMTTAAGVAGGMLLASGISSLFSSGSAEAASGSESAEAPTETANAEQQTEAPAEPSAEEAAALDHEQGGADFQDADFGGDDWGGDFDGFDI